MLLHAVASLAAYEPPGLLKGLVEAKFREVEQLRKLPDARDDGPWGLRLGYPAQSASYALTRALSADPGGLALVADLKRASPGERLGDTVEITPSLDVRDELRRASEAGLTAAMINVDRTSYGGEMRDLREARSCVEPLAAAGRRSPLPLVCKDLIVDPLQIAIAVAEGADAVLLIAAASAGDLPALLDACTLMGVEALVEVHTADELRLATECGASLLLVNQRDRATGRLVPGHAASLAPALPPDAIRIAGGGVARVDQVRTLRRAGYDGVVLGRALATFGGPELLSQLGKEAPMGSPADAFNVKVEVAEPPPSVESEYAP